MEVVSLSPLPVGAVAWQPRQGTWVLTFACKATFRLLPGRADLADEQEPLYREDRHWSDWLVVCARSCTRRAGVESCWSARRSRPRASPRAR
jgi:hypothetical protein